MNRSPLEFLARRQAQVSFTHDNRVIVATLNPERRFERALSSPEFVDLVLAAIATEILEAERRELRVETSVPPPWEPSRFIVAEVSVNWRTGEDNPQALLSQRFEAVIARNLARGYVLHSWRLASANPVLAVGSVVEGTINETIVAVFELDRPAPKPPASLGPPQPPSSRASKSSRSGYVG